MLAGEAAHQLGIERLGKAGIGDGGREAVLAQLLGCLEAGLEPGAEAQDRNLAALDDDATLADLERHTLLRHVDPDAFAARIAEGYGRSSSAAAVATIWTSSASSDAAMTTKLGRQAR